jgi:hypothetical protein
LRLLKELKMVIRLTLLNAIDQLLCILHTDTVADTFRLVAGPPPPPAPKSYAPLSVHLYIYT